MDFQRKVQSVIFAEFRKNGGTIVIDPRNQNQVGLRDWLEKMLAAGKVTRDGNVYKLVPGASSKTRLGPEPITKQSLMKRLREEGSIVVDIDNRCQRKEFILLGGMEDAGKVECERVGNIATFRLKAAKPQN